METSKNNLMSGARTCGSSTGVVLQSSPSSSSHKRFDLPKRKSGWLEKYSVGRGSIFPQNWRKRWFYVDNNGLQYAKSPQAKPTRKTSIPFVAVARDGKDAASLTHRVNKGKRLAPVYVVPIVAPGEEKGTGKTGKFYFAVRFEEQGKNRVMLLRTDCPDLRNEWVRFLSHFVHNWGPTMNVAIGHPLSAQNKRKSSDPEFLRKKDRQMLCSTIIRWDEGVQTRQDKKQLWLNVPIPPHDDAALSGSQRRAYERLGRDETDSDSECTESFYSDSYFSSESDEAYESDYDSPASLEARGYRQPDAPFDSINSLGHVPSRTRSVGGAVTAPADIVYDGPSMLGGDRRRHRSAAGRRRSEVAGGGGRTERSAPVVSARNRLHYDSNGPEEVMWPDFSPMDITPNSPRTTGEVPSSRHVLEALDQAVRIQPQPSPV